MKADSHRKLVAARLRARRVAGVAVKITLEKRRNSCGCVRVYVCVTVHARALVCGVGQVNSISALVSYAAVRTPTTSTWWWP